MADYYPLLAKAVAGLPSSTPETRRAIYERARGALIGQLRRMDPPVPEADVDREAESLEAAVARIEAECAPPTVAEEPKSSEPIPAAPTPPSATAPSSAPVEPTAAEPTSVEPTPTEATPAEPVPRDPTAMAGLAAAASAAAEQPRETSGVAAPGSEPARPPAPKAPPGVVAAQREPRRPPASGSNGPPWTKPDLRRPKAPITHIPPGRARPGAKAPFSDIGPAVPRPSDPRRAPEPVPPEVLSVAQAAASGDALSRQTAAPEDMRVQTPSGDDAAGFIAPSESEERIIQPVARTRPDAQRPFAPRPAPSSGGPKRLWIFGAVLGLFVLVIAITAFELRDRPEDLTGLKQATPSASTEPAPSGKIVDRIGGGAGSVASPTKPAATGAGGQAGALSSAAESTEPAAAVATRAALLVEAPDDPNKVKTFLGSVVWRVDNVSNGPDQPLTTAVRAEIEIPEEKLQAAMTFEKNFDGSLPASHTMKINFTVAPGGPLPDVQQINVPQMRRENAETGDALTGVPVPITQNAFLVGLSRGNAEASNLDLLKSREWIDVPIVLANGRIAKLTFEKGPTGQRALDDVLATWQAQ
ncbi:hypothetical protein [Methylocapsa acidiphila]|uniref:hypothetical protein n=1 Tax=Methylocapsa acidiphila TaxID=133552 RepID=UPI00041A6366|nr:hypothetical protein [Methylocapsa acidiphila]